MSSSKLTVEQIEEALRDNPKFSQVIMEQQRYKQQCRLRALDLSFQAHQRIDNSLTSQVQKMPQNTDYLPNAEKYYKWLIEILPE